MAHTDRSAVEQIKIDSRGLRGDLAAELADPEPGFTHASSQVLKFHGIYQQDDRDLRAARRRMGLEMARMCMVRLGIAGGVLSADQYLLLDQLCDRFGNGSLRVTTRQDVQLHFVDKRALPDLLRALNDGLLRTFGACGDVVRNTTCCPAPLPDRRRAQLARHARDVAAHFKPRTRAYYELWLEGERAVTVEPAAPEPLYGAAYLPRKFKIGFCFPGDNCIDVQSNDVGLVPVLAHDGTIGQFTVLVGGGMGRSHSKPATFPHLAVPLTTVTTPALTQVLEAVVGVHRDHGDRRDRDHARLKYLVAEWGIDRFRGEVATRLGRSIPDAVPFSFDTSEDHLGWHAQGDGRWFVGVKVENGRIVDDQRQRLRSALRAVVERFRPGVHLTAREDVLLTDVAAGDRSSIDALLVAHGVAPAEQWIPLRRNSFACPALPTCGLALTESERVFPEVLEELAVVLAELGLAGIDLHARMTGCPNGCARPYTAEIGFVGRTKRGYDIHLGGDPAGGRLNERYVEDVPLGGLSDALRPVLDLYRSHRTEGEGFGAFCHRVGVGSLRDRFGTARSPRHRSRTGDLAATGEADETAPQGIAP